MKQGMAMAMGLLMVCQMAIHSNPVFAEEKVSTRPVTIDKAPSGTGNAKKDQKCDQIADSDARNLCRAFTRDDFNSGEEKQNRYANKDHSFYYCTLIRQRDKQTYCYAVVRNQKSMCGNIIDSKLEEECNKRVK